MSTTQGLLHCTGDCLRIDVDNMSAGLVWSPGVAGMIFIHAAWCGHCKNMMPAAEAAASIVHADESAMFIAIDESSISADVKTNLSIRGFPTLLTFDETGELTGIHNGGRSQEDLLVGLRGP